MKKKMLITALALGTGTMMLAASVQAATAEEIMEKYMEASQNAAAFSADVDMNLAIGLGITMEGVSMNMDVALLGDLAMDYIKDPLSMQLDGSMSITIPGEEEESVALQLYMVPEEDGSLGCYAYADEGDGGEWEYTAVPAEQLEQVMTLIASQELDITQLPGTLTLGQEGIEIDGTSCTELKNTITYADLEPIISQALEAAAAEDSDAVAELESSLSIVSMALDGLQLNSTVLVADDTSLPMKVAIDFAGSDLSMLNQILAYSFADTDDEGNAVFPEIALDISNLYIQISYNYDAPAEITVPEEGLAAKAYGDTDTLSEALEDAVDEIAG